MLPGKLPGNGVLGHVGVLELVDKEVLETGAVLLQHVRVVPKEGVGLEQQVVEVHGVVGVEQLLIPTIDVADDPLHGAVHPRRVVVRLYQLALGGGDGGENRPWREALGVVLKLLHRLLKQLQLVLLVVDDEGAVEAGVVGLTAQNLGAEGVERGDGEVAAHIPQVSEKGRRLVAFAPAKEPVAHLPRRLVGEGYGRNAAGVNAAFHHQIGYAMGDDPGLAAARARQNQQRPIDRLYGLSLRRVQSFQYVYVHLRSGGL